MGETMTLRILAISISAWAISASAWWQTCGGIWGEGQKNSPPPPPRKSAEYQQLLCRFMLGVIPLVMLAVLVAHPLTKTNRAVAQAQDNYTGFGVGAGSASGTMLTQQFGMHSFYAPLASISPPTANTNTNATSPNTTDTNADADSDAEYGGRYRMTTQFSLTPPVDVGEGSEWHQYKYRLGFGHWRHQCQNQNQICLWLKLPSGLSEGN